VSDLHVRPAGGLDRARARNRRNSEAGLADAAEGPENPAVTAARIEAERKAEAEAKRQARRSSSSRSLTA
jgi:hypothetical protein